MVKITVREKERYKSEFAASSTVSLAVHGVQGGCGK